MGRSMGEVKKEVEGLSKDDRHYGGQGGSSWGNQVTQQWDCGFTKYSGFRVESG